MDLQAFLDKMNSGEEIEAGSDYHLFMGKLSQEALKITAEMNNQYRTPEELMELMRKLTGKCMKRPKNSSVRKATGATRSPIMPVPVWNAATI